MTTEALDTIRILDQFDKDCKYLARHRNEWVTEYPDRWVVVYKEELVCQADSFQSAFDEAITRGVAGSDLVIEFITDKPRTLIL